MKSIIHFAHANGVPSRVYEKMLISLSKEYEIIYIEHIGIHKSYPITNHWNMLVDQVIDSIICQAKGKKVIGLGHSLGSLLTLLASIRRPELFTQIIMLDPPLILGYDSFIFHFTKLFSSKKIDQITPAGLSKNRREHWVSREQAASMLRSKGFFRKMDEDCFQSYINYGLKQDPIRGGVTLTIPRDNEVSIFRNNPSWWWLFTPTLKLPVHIIAGKESPFYQKKYFHIAKKKMKIDFSLSEGGHMFPLEFPLETAIKIKTNILN